MQNVESGSLFEFRFKLRTLLYAITAVSLFMALCPLIATEVGFAVFELTFLAISAGVTALAVRLATRNAPRYLGILIACHLILAIFLVIGPIASYHINGRAWYDYGISAWDPPPFHFSDGTVGISDYDPKFTRPAIWPIIGPVMYVMCWLGVGVMIVPPTAPIVSVAVFVAAIRLRHVLTMWQSCFVWVTWAIGLVPVVYMMLWGVKMLGWIGD